MSSFMLNQLFHCVYLYRIRMVQYAFRIYNASWCKCSVYAREFEKIVEHDCNYVHRPYVILEHFFYIEK